MPTGGRPRAAVTGRPVARSSRLVAALLALTVVAVQGSWPGRAEAVPGGQVDRVLQERAAAGPDRSLPVLIHRRARTRAADMVRAHGGRVRRELAMASLVAAEVPASRLGRLASDPNVVRISYDAPVRGPISLEGAAAASDVSHAAVLQAARLSSRSQSIDGAGIAVAVLDTGIADHPDFRGAERGGARVIARVARGSSADQAGGDDYGHGTWVAGVVGGRGTLASGRGEPARYAGVAPGVSLVSVRVAGPDGVARVSDVVDGIEWVLANKERHNIRVLNLSLVSSVAESYRTSLLDAAVELAWRRGIVVVVAAGNAGPDTVGFAPANDPHVIVVGATDDMGTATTADDRLASFSSYGVSPDGFARPDLVAPGRRVVAPLASPDADLAVQFPDRIVERAYIRLSGTSASTAMVSGLAALLLQARPDLTPAQVKWLLLRTARAVPGDGTGAGYPQAGAAISYAGPVGRANQQVEPNLLVARALAAAGTWPANVSWDNVSWDNVSWDNVSWDNVSWDNVSWDNVSD